MKTRYILLGAVVLFWLYWHYCIYLLVQRLKRDPILAKLLEEN